MNVQRTIDYGIEKLDYMDGDGHVCTLCSFCPYFCPYRRNLQIQANRCSTSRNCGGQCRALEPLQQVVKRPSSHLEVLEVPVTFTPLKHMNLLSRTGKYE